METSDSSASDQYSCGINPGNHGISFEKDHAFITFVAASLDECKYKLAAEMIVAEKFDDVVLFNEKSKDVWLFQAKHSEKEGHISFEDLFSTDPKKGNFAFSRYLQSYMRIREKKDFSNYKPTVFIFTNKALKDSEELNRLLIIRTQNVDSMIRWCDSEKYVCFEPLDNEAVNSIAKTMNSELLEIKKDIENLSKTGKISDLLVQYKAPLQKILQMSEGIISFKVPEVTSLDFATHKWLLSEFEVEPNESLLMNKLDDRTVKNLNTFFTGSSRNKQPSVPRIVKEEDAREFFRNLVFCVEQPTDLRSVAEKLISAWMHRWVKSNDLGLFGKDQTKVFLSYFDEEFDKWHKNTRTPKDYLKFEKEGTKCIERIKTELKKKLLKKNSLISFDSSMYVNRIIIVNKTKDEDDEKESQNIITDGNKNLNIQQKRGKLIYESLDRGSDGQIMHVGDNDFIEQLTKITTKNKCQVLIAEPGMGKTTLITHIFSQLEQSKTLDVYPIRLKNLRKYENFQIFEHELSKESRNILLKDLKNEEIHILFLLDGFDEMNPTHFESVMEAIENLLTKPNTQFIITGRNHVQKLLEDKFKVTALNLKPFDHKEQVKFLKCFWKVNDQDDLLFKDFSKQLLEKFNSEIKATDYDFTELPLLVRMLAEVYTGDFNKFLKNKDFSQLNGFSEKLHVLSLFDKFVKISFNMQMKKLFSEIPNAFNIVSEEIAEELKPSFDIFDKQLQLLAIQYLKVGELQYVTNQQPYAEYLKQIQERVRGRKEKSMLICASSTNKIDFIHLSYAEYFVAKFIFNHIKEHKSYIKTIIKSHHVVRIFFFFMVENSCSEKSEAPKVVQSLYSRDSFVIALVCMGGHEKIAMLLLKIYMSAVSKLLRKLSISAVDTHHAILLHAAAFGGSTGLVLTLLDTLRVDVNYRPSVNFYGTHFDFIKPGDSAILVALRKTHLEIVKLLVHRGAEVNEGNDFRCTPLHLAAQNNHLDVAKLLIEKNSNFEIKDFHGSKPLHLAAQNGHLEVVKLLTDSYANVDATNNDGFTPLHLAAKNGNLEVAKLLLASNANVDIEDRIGRTPLHLAAKNAYLDIVKLLIETNANIDATENDGVTSLHSAAHYGHLEVVKLLNDNNANVDIAKNDGIAPLHSAVENGNLEMAKLLIDSNANVDTEDFIGRTPLHFAAETGNLEMTQLLIVGKAEIDSKDCLLTTPLHSAAKHGNLQVLKLLIDSSANVNTRTKNGFTPVHTAAHYGHVEVVKLLLDKSVNVGTSTNNGLTPLHSAAQYGHFEVAKMLIAYNANCDITTNSGFTALHFAAENGHLEIVKLLIDSEANVDRTTNNGLAPLHLAAKSGHFGIVKLLVDSNANVNIISTTGWTPLHAASAENHLEVCEFLIDHGSWVNCSDNDGTTPLIIAARHGHVDVEKLLLTHDAESRHIADNDGTTPEKGHIEMDEEPISIGAEINARNQDGFAVENQQHELVDLLQHQFGNESNFALRRVATEFLTYCILAAMNQ